MAGAARAFPVEEGAEHHRAVVEADNRSPSQFPSVEEVLQEIRSQRANPVEVPETGEVQMTSFQMITLEAEQEPDMPVQLAVAAQVVELPMGLQLSKSS